ncbi:MAG: folate-binding protein [Alphaproteobacteria bacterium]|nr:folate-binding protein [Alphaproteobacteria bacterium]
MNACFVKLKNRALIHLEGLDRHHFLQGLVTNDIDKLTPTTPLYACLLTPQGKFLYDFFIYEGDDFTLLDCEGGARAESLYKRLNMYRLRMDVQISIEDNVPVYAVFGKAIGLPDPRHEALGYRSFEKPDLPEEPFETWDKKRIELCVPDGSRDLVPEKSTMDEGNMDGLNAISYDKGCYVGQEITARMHYRGLGKKHLQTVYLSSRAQPRDLNPSQNEQIPPLLTVGRDDNDIELRSSCGDMGIALVRRNA